jgi:S-adenosylmethionine hydrolase
MNQPNLSSITCPLVALMTDFGLEDGDVGVMKGVIMGITSEAHIIDITHEIAPQNVRSGAWILAASYRYFPANTVFICVIDPGVGSSRRAIAVHAGDWFFVGPDNGLFSYIFAEQIVHKAIILSNTTYHLPQISSTFHGRDIFAPVGAHLAYMLKGNHQESILHKFGTSIEPTTLERIDLGPPVRHGTRIEAHIVHIDRFGNLITSIPLTIIPDLLSSLHVRLTFTNSNIVVERCRRFFADGTKDDEPFIYGDSSGYVGIAVQNGNAARTLRVGSGASITLDAAEK